MACLTQVLFTIEKYQERSDYKPGMPTYPQTESLVYPSPFVVALAAEAPCKHLVDMAKAHVANTPQPSAPMRAFARIRGCDAEAGCQRVFKKYHRIPPVKVDNVAIGPGVLSKFPYIKLSSWVRWLLDSGRLPRYFVGVNSFDKMKVVLKEFWKRYRDVHPSHGIFQLFDSGAVPCDRTIPFYSHTDEGRSYKHIGIWVMSSHGCLGRGTQSYVDSGDHRKALGENEFGLNYLGSTWSTQFIFSTMLKTVYNKYPDAQEKLIELYAADVSELLYDGVVSKDGDYKVHFMHLSTKGDLPALAKLGQFKRSYAHVPRAAASRSSCPGVCHLCLAGVEAGGEHARSIPFEDMGMGAAWINTLHSIVPWDSPVGPSIVQGLPLTMADSIAFFVTDFWHNFHLGVAKHWIGSSMVSIIESDLPSVVGNSVESKFKWLTNLYLAFFKAKRVNPYILEISRETMGFPQASVCPIARWSKGAAATQFMQFLDWFCQNYVMNRTHNELLLSIVSDFLA